MSEFEKVFFVSAFKKKMHSFCLRKSNQTKLLCIATEKSKQQHGSEYKIECLQEKKTANLV